MFWWKCQFPSTSLHLRAPEPPCWEGTWGLAHCCTAEVKCHPRTVWLCFITSLRTYLCQNQEMLTFYNWGNLLKGQADRKDCNWCGWNYWIPKLCKLRGTFAVSLHHFFSNSPKPTWSLYHHLGGKMDQTQHLWLLRGKGWVFLHQWSLTFTHCPKLMNYLFSLSLKK